MTSQSHKLVRVVRNVSSRSAFRRSDRSERPDLEMVPGVQSSPSTQRIIAFMRILRVEGRTTRTPNYSNAPNAPNAPNDPNDPNASEPSSGRPLQPRLDAGDHVMGDIGSRRSSARLQLLERHAVSSISRCAAARRVCSTMKLMSWPVEKRATSRRREAADAQVVERDGRPWPQIGATRGRRRCRADGDQPDSGRSRVRRDRAWPPPARPLDLAVDAVEHLDVIAGVPV